MIIRGSTDPNDTDWTFGTGKQSYLTGNNAIMKNIETRLKVYYSECFFSPDEGFPWLDFLGRKDRDALLLALQKAITDCYGVVRVTDLQYSVDKQRNVTINYWVDTIYSTSAAGSIVL